MFDVAQRDDVLTAEQCASLIAEHRDGMLPSAIGYGGGGRVDMKVRSSSSRKLSLSGEIAETLAALVMEATGASCDRLEQWELVHYPLGGFFRPHTDWLNPISHRALYAQGGQRTHSALVYLCDVELGGETVFRHIRKAFRPRLGRFLAWPNIVNGQPSRIATHESRPVRRGEKWVLVTWVREHAG